MREASRKKCEERANGKSMKNGGLKLESIGISVNIGIQKWIQFHILGFNEIQNWDSIGISWGSMGENGIQRWNWGLIMVKW